ncbi:UbiH/UbiF/VisC/COQ6 family ubiquinone biosynthesis hydroxylase [Zooshikella ganghwensis]|uniref:2-octaprenyl-3-methyl-6-methoxy-1,4-benzoquinol hydroxylase n=1 Tax=Zooshikella ganghwensis TaxID=202772 RepID=A0A4P9VJS9_9GAMM|nr:UbiH/UbiF/VisC/COQ6 family ubiquinone biosynthesis hydroxylase [Zooshikella ganghwensis]RDH42052.1 2-octaprenyl-3-methyl-6-methoxy-1,4-benzoquinol hydroxylase [Zooshikella ganghwensis]
MKSYDIVIVGGGMVGAAIALGISQQTDYKIAIVDHQPLDQLLSWPKRDCIDNRVSAVTLATVDFLKQLNVWDTIAVFRSSAFKRMFVWDSEGTGHIQFTAEEVHRPQLGYIIENRAIQAALWQQLEKDTAVDVYSEHVLTALVANTPAVLSSTSQNTHFPVTTHPYSVVLNDGQELSASLVIGADGAKSQVRRLAKFTTREWDYLHHALVATVKWQKKHQQTAWQVFLPTGPLALLPLNSLNVQQHVTHQNTTSIVWSAPASQIGELIKTSKSTLLRQLSQATERCLGDAIEIDDLASFPLRQRHAKQYYKKGVVLAGDAAHTIHPLAGQGMNLGMADAMTLVTEVTRAANRGDTPGGEHILSRYQRQRMPDNLMMMGLMESFQHTFQSEQLPVRWLRNQGLNWVNKQGWLKQQLIKKAVGL